MTRRCMATGKTVMTGNNVSHANNKTRRRYLPNLQWKSLLSEIMGQTYRLRLSTHAIRTIEFHGGLDAFLMRSNDADLDLSVRKIKKLVKARKLAA